MRQEHWRQPLDLVEFLNEVVGSVTDDATKKPQMALVLRLSKSTPFKLYQKKKKSKGLFKQKIFYYCCVRTDYNKLEIKE